jgi:hypothetical protein
MRCILVWREIVDHLRITYHMPCARVSFLGTRAASDGIQSNSLETDRIWTRGHLSVAPEILQFFLVLRGIIIWAIFYPFSLFANGCTRTPGTVIPHVPGALFWIDDNLNEVKKSHGAAWRHFICHGNYSVCKNWDTTIILKNPLGKGLSRPEFYGFQGKCGGKRSQHGIVCRNEVIFGTCVNPRMGSKTSDADF